MRTRQLTAATTVAAAALLLSACGSSPLEGKTGEEVSTLAADALEEAGSVHVVGTMDQDGEEGELDLQLQGDDASGSISLAGLEIELVVVGEEVFIRAPADFWAGFGMPAEAAAEFEDTWVIVPAEAAADFADFSLSGIADELRDPDGEVAEETRSDEVDGDPVRIVEQADGSTLTVADDDPAYPLEMASEEDGTTLTFSRFGEEQEISAPDDAVDLEQVMGG
jgi:hypothetical protein